MKAIWKFRLLALFILVCAGGVSISNLAAEFLRPAALPLAAITSKAPSPDQVSSARLAATIAPFRSDLKGDYAVALAAQALSSENRVQTDEMRIAQDTVRSALRTAPHDSRMWLTLALLEARSTPADPHAAESLKLSYLTGPNRAELIPVRLRSATTGSALSDADLGELVRGDVRAILVHFPDWRPMLVNDYAGASETGKKFLEESVRTIDPTFADALRGKK